MSGHRSCCGIDRENVHHEAVNARMQARNPSAIQSTELILFQVGGKGEPLMLMAKPRG
jgi:hypothetical protein